MPSNNNLDLLLEAIARNAGIVLSLPSAGLLRHHKSRFLAEAPEGFWVESVPEERALVTELVGNQHPAGLSFKSGVTKVIFTAPILRYDPEYRINADTIVQALLVAFPAEIKAVQRRNNYRVAASGDLQVTVWRIAERAVLRDRPLASQIVKCKVHDISIGGLGVTFLSNPNDDRPKVTEEDRLRVEFKTEDVTFLAEGRMRKPAPAANPDPKMIRTGIAFKSMEHDLEGRQTLAALTRIVGALQREEVRRHRLGTKSA